MVRLKWKNKPLHIEEDFVEDHMDVKTNDLWKKLLQEEETQQSGLQAEVSGEPLLPGVYRLWDQNLGDVTFNISSGSGSWEMGNKTGDTRSRLTNLMSGNGDGSDRGVEDLYGLDEDEYLMSEDFLKEIRSQFFQHKQTEIAVLIFLYTLVFAVGLIGNALVIYIFTKNRKMRTVTNSFLVNLAVCDLMVVCMCMPFSVALEIYDNWIYGDAMCKIVTFVQGLSVISSILTLTVISAERFYAIRKPLRARAFMSRARIQTIIGIIWIVSGISVLPTVFVRKEIVNHIFSVKMSQCVEQWGIISLKHVYNFALLLILYMGPVIFICVGYLHIGMNLWRSDSGLHACNSAAESENARANLNGRRRVARMLFVLAILFALSWLPYHVMSILMDFLSKENLNEHGRLLRYVHSFALWLGHTNSSVNPICYCIMSSSFKSALQMHFRMCCLRRTNFQRDSFMSLSMSVTVSTSNSSGKNNSTRVVYKPIVGRTCSTSPDLLKNTSRIRIERCDDV